MKKVVITGANSGMGLAAAIALAKRGFSLILTVRSQEKADFAIRKIKEQSPSAMLDVVIMDLSDLASVRAAAEEILSRHSELSVLINNAGYFPEKIEFELGIEKAFVACHLGHMLFTLMLQPALEKSGEGRIISYSSGLFMMGRYRRFFKQLKGIRTFEAYADAKLANILFIKGLAKRIPPQLLAFALHPGLVASNFDQNLSGFSAFVWRLFKPFYRKPETGASTGIFLATVAPEQIRDWNGLYLYDCRPAPVSRNPDVNERNAEELWERSMAVIRPYLPEGQTGFRRDV